MGRSINETLAVYEQNNILKSEERLRKGWVLREVKGRIESVSEHVAGMLNLAILISHQYKTDLDMQRVYEMIGIHEFGEIKIGDITPFDGISKREKHRREKEAIIELLANHPGRDNLLSLWEEFESLSSNEAIFVYLLDKFQALLEAKRISREQDNPEIFNSFYNDYENIFARVIEWHGSHYTPAWIKAMQTTYY